MGDREFWFWDWFVLGTRIFHEGGVMIHWIGPLGRRVAANDHVTKLFCLGVVVSLGFCTLIH